MLINHKKTKFYNRGNKIKILGAVITPNNMITVDKRLKSDIEILFHFYKTDRLKYNEILEQRFNNNEKKVYGILSYINSLDSAFLLKLRKKYGNYIVDAFLHRSLYE
jgi:RNA-directed DNA polymerase